MFVGRVRMKHMGLLLLACLFAIGIIATLIFLAPDVLPRGETWKHRIENFAGGGDEGDNFQSDQSQIAIATGGILGKGPGNSIQRNFLPHPYSDFIFAIIVEEYGLVGGVFILFLYLIILFRAGMIARKSEYRFPSLVATGLSFSLVFQAMINMAVAVNLIPVTGQTLPMVSMGGSSIIFTSVSFGLLLSVSRCLDADDEKIVDTQSEDEKTEKNTDHTKKPTEEKPSATNHDEDLDEDQEKSARDQAPEKKPVRVKEVGMDDDDLVEEMPRPRPAPKIAREFDPDEIDARTEKDF
jgi:cell division protein FtsW